MPSWPLGPESCSPLLILRCLLRPKFLSNLLWPLNPLPNISSTSLLVCSLSILLPKMSSTSSSPLWSLGCSYATASDALYVSSPSVVIGCPHYTCSTLLSSVASNPFSTPLPQIPSSLSSPLKPLICSLFHCPRCNLSCLSSTASKQPLRPLPISWPLRFPSSTCLEVK
jgi:hypothetical protein